VDVEAENRVKFILSIITFIYENLIVLMIELIASFELCFNPVAYRTPEAVRNSGDKIIP
jgi:hypothetical protein